MRFETVADVLNTVKDLHTALARQFGELEQLTTSERAQLMLDYLHRHEKQLALAMEQYEKQAGPGIMDTWLQYAPQWQPQELIDKVRGVDLNDVDSIVKVALEVDDYLVDLYREAAEESDIPEVKEAFASFAQVEDNERHKTARSAFRLSDI